MKAREIEMDKEIKEIITLCEETFHKRLKQDLKGGKTCIDRDGWLRSDAW